MQENRFPNQNEIIGLVLAFAPFICNFTTTTTRTVNGVTVEETSTDYADIILGALAVVIALTIIPSIRAASPDSRLKHAGIFVLVLAVGIFQILSGSGTL
ncbi:MAG: hypothetical protein KJ064_16735 [Anaerolineae bacterium]|jgi:hypothetical protein|nr:hypothetical protein [Anaerolineae bacterium]